MITKPTSLSELKEIFVKILLNHTSKVTKISDESVLNGIAFGVSKIGQKALKDISLIEAHIFVDSAYGTQLDSIAIQRGVAPRFTSLGSSTFLRLVGMPGTVYTSTIHKFTGSHGITFELEGDATIPISGYLYVKVRSSSTGLRTNVDPLTITKITTSLTGHRYVINEYKAIGGRDIEGDDEFRQRIKEGINYLSTGTLAALTQVFMSINPNVLRVIYNGLNSNGKAELGIVTQNGVDLNPTELSQLLTEGDKFLSITDLKAYGTQENGVVVQNISYTPIDVDFRVELLEDASPDLVRIDLQTKFSKYIDFRYWDYNKKVEWDDLLSIVKNAAGVKYVPDVYFSPNSDLIIPINSLPRFRSFIMRNSVGGIIENQSGTLNDYYYPGVQDNYFVETALMNL